MIRTAALAFILAITGLCCEAQGSMPSYPDVIRKFASRYNVSEDYNNYTNFAKKKEGWYVQQLNRELGDKMISEHLYYSLERNKYLNLKAYYDTTYTDSPNTVLARLLNAGDWYSYERVRYYGYNGWAKDLINDFGNQANLSDTMHDGLGRAYSAKISDYLWYQSGGFYSGNDSLRVKLKRLQFPSGIRIDSVKAQLAKTINEFEQLQKLSPNYKTLVGNGTLKVFNEYMYAYNQLLLCGDLNAARAFAAKASLQQGHIDQAKNHLNSCAPNAILFTYGDNDTYQLWYVQEVLGYRKDIAVINTGLLGLPIYTEALKSLYGLNIGAPARFLNDEGADVSYFKESKTAPAAKSAQAFLRDIYFKKDSFPSRTAEGKVISYAQYSDTAAYFTMQNAAHRQVKIKFALKKAFYLNEILMLDIINSNINSRPIYFTSDESILSDHFLLSGINYKLVTENIRSADVQKKEEADMEKFFNEKYIPVLSNDSGFISYDGDGSFILLHATALSFYKEKGDTDNLRKWANSFYKGWYASKRETSFSLFSFGFYFIEAGYNKRGLEIMEEVADWMYKLHLAPDATKGYTSSEDCRSKIAGMQNYLSSKDISSIKIDVIANKLDQEEFE